MKHQINKCRKADSNSVDQCKPFKVRHPLHRRLHSPTQTYYQECHTDGSLAKTNQTLTNFKIIAPITTTLLNVQNLGCLFKVKL